MPNIARRLGKRQSILRETYVDIQDPLCGHDREQCTSISK